MMILPAVVALVSVLGLAVAVAVERRRANEAAAFARQAVDRARSRAAAQRAWLDDVERAARRVSDPSPDATD